jgi:hypothetical protein
VIPQANATVLKVEAPSTTDEWKPEDEELNPPDAYSGAAPAYYQERRERVLRGEAQDLLVRRTLIVEEGRPPVGWAAGQTVAFRVEGDAADSTATVQHVERRRWAPAGSLQTTRLTLEDI